MNHNDIRSNKQLIEAMTVYMFKPEYLFFWGHSVPRSGVNETCLSQWYPSQFNISTLSFPTAEHYMMASKAALHNDEETISKIMKAKHPSDAKRLGRRIKEFNDPLWKSKRMNVVVTGNYEKFTQNPELAEFLISTGNTVLVEASPVDNIWGIGMPKGAKDIEDPREWKGENLLGYALMEVRTKLRNETGPVIEIPDSPKNVKPEPHKTESKVMGEFYSDEAKTQAAQARVTYASPYQPYTGYKQYV